MQYTVFYANKSMAISGIMAFKSSFFGKIKKLSENILSRLRIFE
jgi:hypothetical protein